MNISIIMESFVHDIIYENAHTGILYSGDERHKYTRHDPIFPASATVTTHAFAPPERLKNQHNAWKWLMMYGGVERNLREALPPNLAGTYCVYSFRTRMHLIRFRIHS